MQPTDPTQPTAAGHSGHVPYVPPPPGGPPPIPPPAGPPAPAVPPPAFTSTAGAKATTLVAVTNRILWVGQSAYPLSNVARVATTLIVPGRRRALLRLLFFTLVVAVFAFAIASAFSQSDSFSSSRYRDSSSSDSGVGVTVALAVAVVVVYFLIFTWPVLRRPDLYALAVDTAGPPTALLAWHTPRPAQDLQAAITRAIENPQAEFQQIVHSLTVDLRKYQFGDRVNIYGGQGNTGITK
ncbi:DUF6232 family protein [Kitasatospora sp. NPDC004799]|uniref:DUF6232 family protein n=1 Tax=Kitasatospora sp. NPDC004799 TaxID=3154460 RepID=UPI0033AD2D28